MLSHMVKEAAPLPARPQLFYLFKAGGALQSPARHVLLFVLAEYVVCIHVQRLAQICKRVYGGHFLTVDIA